MFSSSGDGDVNNNNNNSSSPFRQWLQSGCSSTMSDDQSRSRGLSSSSPYLMMFDDPEITTTDQNTYPYPPNNSHGQLMTLPFLLPTYPYYNNNNTYPHLPPPPPPSVISCNYDCNNSNNNPNEMLTMMMMMSGGGSSSSSNSTSTMTMTMKKKKERHSKIETASGVRDRRVRLSIATSRKFFDLQDMLGFDKPSKTLDWLLSHSEPAIHRLQKLQLEQHPTGDIMELENEDDEEDGDDDHDQEHEPLLLNQHLQGRERETRTKDKQQQQQQEPFGIGRVISNSYNSLFTTATTTPPASTQIDYESFTLMKWHLKHPESSLTTLATKNHAIPSPIFPHRHHHHHHHQDSANGTTTASTWDINASTGLQLNGRFWEERDHRNL